MPRGRRRLPPVAGTTSVEALEMQNFARRLFEAMNKKGMSQSDLAAAIWGRTTDKRGYSVARNRDRISVYLQGRSYPDPKNAETLAAVLGVKIEDLAPALHVATVEREAPPWTLTPVANDPRKTYFAANLILPTSVALHIATLIDEATQ